MDDAARLTEPEQLLLFSFRMLAYGRGHCPVVKSAFARECGDRAAQALPAFQTALLFVGREGVRKLKARHPGCPEITADEEALLAMFAAAQRSIRTGQEHELHSRLEWLMGRRANEGLVLAAQTVAAALAANQRFLPDRRVPEAERARPVWRELRVVH